MTSRSNTETAQERQRFPSSPDITALAGMLYQALEGILVLGANGRRLRMQPEPGHFRVTNAGLPELPQAQPHETFLNGDEYRGAMKVLGYVIDRLSESDRELLFCAFADQVEPEADQFDFREMLNFRDGPDL